MLRLPLFLILASSVLAQDMERNFRLVHAFDAQAIEEIAMTLRTVSRLQPAVDNTARTISVKGTSSDIALAEWLIQRLDVFRPIRSGSDMFRVAGSPDDLVALYALKQRDLPLQSFQEMLTTLRTVAGIQTIFGVHGPEIIVLRGSASNIASSNFLLSQLDTAPTKRDTGEKVRFDIPEGNPVLGDTLSIYRLAHATGNLDIQEIATILRLVIPLHAVYQVSANNTYALRGNVDELDASEWLISQLDLASPNSEVSQMTAPGGNAEQIRVFHLAHVKNGREIGQLMKTVREQTGLKWSYYSTRIPAIAIRGTPNALNQAQEMVKNADVSPTP